jgi:hypothetical protein
MRGKAKPSFGRPLFCRPQKIIQNLERFRLWPAYKVKCDPTLILPNYGSTPEPPGKIENDESLHVGRERQTGKPQTRFLKV